MVEELLDDKKFIVVPAAIANRLRIVSGRLGSSAARYAEEVFTQAFRVDEMGSSLEEAVDTYRLFTVQRGAGSICVNRAYFKELVERLYLEDAEGLSGIWYESGRWYGSYLLTKLNGEDVFGFLEKDLLVMWNLDEAEIRREDVIVSIRCTSFGMSRELTDLLVHYLVGLMEEIGYSENDREVLRGLVMLKFLKKME
ncbi:MAG TPA: hypothetical protein VMW03_06380 [Candidatus Krumholzibacteriaceae bacterium]|nr:hypothetical protein [Candidatus Krumholzibacteriaceae bacterium]